MMNLPYNIKTSSQNLYFRYKLKAQTIEALPYIVIHRATECLIHETLEMFPAINAFAAHYHKHNYLNTTE